MALINSRILQVAAHNEVHAEMNRRISIFKTLHPRVQLLYLDKSDTPLPLCSSVVEAMRKSVEEMNGPDGQHSHVKGHHFLINAIVKHDFRARGMKINAEEIFVSAGAKQDISGISDILCKDNRLALMDPISQIYVQSNAIAYRAGAMEGGEWSNVVYLPLTIGGGCVPAIPEERFDVVFLTSPCNPTGMALERQALTEWVNYAIANDVIIFFDASYEAFVSDSGVPRSIYEIKGANRVAIEFHSFAKSGGFRGMHCGYTVIPQEVTAYSLSYSKRVALWELWLQRQIVKGNSPSLMVQRAAEALYTAQGRAEMGENVAYYMLNAALLRQALEETNLRFMGGINSPYLWLCAPQGDSWQLFDLLLNKCSIVSVPGEMYGGNPDGCVRLSALAQRREAAAAAAHIKDYF